MLLLLFRIQPPIVLSEFRSSQHAFDGFAGAQDADDAAMIRHAGVNFLIGASLSCVLAATAIAVRLRRMYRSTRAPGRAGCLLYRSFVSARVEHQPNGPLFGGPDLAALGDRVENFQLALLAKLAR
jgi:hypothetical protein